MGQYLDLVAQEIEAKHSHDASVSSDGRPPEGVTRLEPRQPANRSASSEGYAVNDINAVIPPTAAQRPELSPAEEARFAAVVRQVEAERWEIPARRVRVWGPPPCRPSRKRPGDG